MEKIEKRSVYFYNGVEYALVNDALISNSSISSYVSSDRGSVLITDINGNIIFHVKEGEKGLDVEFLYENPPVARNMVDKCIK